MTRPGWSRVTLSPLLRDNEVNYFIDSVRLFVRYQDKIMCHYTYDPKTGGFIPHPVEITTGTLIAGERLMPSLDGFIAFTERPKAMLADRLNAVRLYLETIDPTASNVKETVVSAWREWHDVKLPI